MTRFAGYEAGPDESFDKLLEKPSNITSPPEPLSHRARRLVYDHIWKLKNAEPLNPWPYIYLSVEFEAHASFRQLCLRGVARRSEPTEAMADDSLSFAAMTAADLVKAELLLAPMPPRPQSSVIDVEVAFSVSVANYCSAGDRIIFTKLDNDECWTVDALGSVISVTAIGDRWGVLLDGPPQKAVLASPSCFSVLAKDAKLVNKFNELGRYATEQADVATSPTRLDTATKEPNLATPLKQMPARSYDAIASALDKGNMLVASGIDDTLYVESV